MYFAGSSKFASFTWLFAILAACSPQLSLAKSSNSSSPCDGVCKCHLTKVDCSKRELNSIPENLPYNTTWLDLSNNQISDLTGLGHLKKLTVLYLVGNELTEWKEEWLNGSQLLEELRISENKLSEPPKICKNSPNLRLLLLDSNKLNNTAFPSDYINCKALEKISLSMNSYPKVDRESFKNLAKSPVKSVKLRRTNLQSASSGSLASLASNLESLDLGQNPELSEKTVQNMLNGAEFKKLLNLQLTGSSLKKLPEISAQNLRVLSLDKSKNLSELPAAATQQLKNLQILSLRDTQISNWSSDAISNLAKLNELDMRNTLITTIGGIDGNSNPLPQLNHSNFKDLRLAGAKLTCDCNLLWLTQQLSLKPKVFTDIKRARCYQPKDKHNLPLLQFKPENCGNSTQGDDAGRVRTIALISALSVATVVIAGFATLAVLRFCRREAAPRLVLDDDLSDPLVTPGERASIWIRLRSLLRYRRSHQQQQQRPPIFQEAAPEDHLSPEA